MRGTMFASGKKQPALGLFRLSSRKPERINRGPGPLHGGNRRGQLRSSLNLLSTPLCILTLFGMTLNSATRDLTQFYDATSSIRSVVFVARRNAKHLWELLLHKRSVRPPAGMRLLPDS